MYSVILCGGSGTRLWPLSRKNYPKQFLKLYNKNSLLQETYLRMRKITPSENIYFVTNENNAHNVYSQIIKIEKNYNEKNIIIEPRSLNTAPAIALSVKYLLDKKNINKKDPIVFLPSDHFIKNEKKFLLLVKRISKSLKNNIATIGIVPTRADTGYGYIQKGRKKENYFCVDKFKEKPDLETANKYIESNKYLWNSGIYIFSAQTFLDEAKRHAPKIYRSIKLKYNEFIKKFPTLKPDSIDYAISEKSKKVIVFAGNFGWSDIGSFDSLEEIINKKNKRLIKKDSRNIFSISTSKKLITVLGVKNIGIIESNDSIFVYKKGRSHEVKDIVNVIKDKKQKEINDEILVNRFWGKYEVLLDGPYMKVKKLTVNPGAKLSLQSHKRREENWIVVKGKANVINGKDELILKKNERTFIPKNTKHRLGNPYKSILEIIEVQTGDYFGEDDITRYEDIYNRK